MARRRMPAVSTNTIGPSSVSTSVSIASRVVPGMSCTTERSSPTSRLNSVLLPTLGRPTIATRGGGPSSSTAELLEPVGVVERLLGLVANDRLVAEPLEHDVEQVAGAPAVQGAHRDGVAEAEREELPDVVLAAVVVGLVGDDQHRATRRAAASRRPIRRPRATPTLASTTNSTRSASATAASTWRLTLSSRSLPCGIQPPVSITRNGTPEPLGLELLAVAGDARPVLDDRRLLADDAVEQRALADVRAPDDHDRGQLGRRRSCRLARARAAARCRRWRRPRPAAAGRRP